MPNQSPACQHEKPAALVTLARTADEISEKSCEGDGTTVSRKRQPETEAESVQVKKFKHVIDTVADEYICPITTELPIDPVTAEDGRVYERSAIKKWIKVQREDLKSPYTNQPMGPRLLPAVQVRNTIVSLVKSGAIVGNKAQAWKKKIADEELVAETIEKAEGGDVDKMYLLGCWHRTGRKGLAKDLSTAYRWFKKGSDLRDARCIARVAKLFCTGNGVEKNSLYGCYLLTMAAASGSEYASFWLGVFFKEGDEGFPINLEEAKYWLLKVANDTCTVPSGKNELPEKAIRHLEELKE